MDYKSLKEWFYFSKKERNAVLVLAIVILLFFLIPYFFPKKTIDTSSQDFGVSDTITKSIISNADLFNFDPNTIGIDDWRKLGLRDKTIQTIIHYRQKGGIFHHPDDIRKIYGLTPAQADKLIPYITIYKKSQLPTFQAKNIQTHYPIEINEASKEKWAQLPGISDYLAARIVHYRSAMHGFKNIEQVANTYGMTPKLLEQIKPFLRMSLPQRIVTVPQDTFTEKRTVKAYLNTTKNILVNINTATELELMNAGISKNISKAIVIYREQHGEYNSVEDVKKIVFITPIMYEKIYPLLFVK